jgi:CheY-like chemotaxis protein
MLPLICTWFSSTWPYMRTLDLAISRELVQHRCSMLLDRLPFTASMEGRSILSVVNVLVVDPFEPWRRFVLLILKDNPSLQIIGVASDGLETVQKAGELQPDLIVMEISLPKLNGIDAARQIRSATPKCKILFLSREPDPEVARFVLREGARGYVLKEDLVKDLSVAVETVILGKRFVSRGLAFYDFSDTAES